MLTVSATREIFPTLKKYPGVTCLLFRLGLNDD